MFYAVINLYVYLLCIINWPVKVYVKEFDIDAEQEGFGVVNLGPV